MFKSIKKFLQYSYDLNIRFFCLSEKVTYFCSVFIVLTLLDLISNYLVSIPFSWLFDQLPKLKNLTQNSTFTKDGIPEIIFILFICFIAPIYEEIIFRGLITKDKNIIILIIFILSLSYWNSIFITILIIFIGIGLFFNKQINQISLVLSSIAFGISHYNLPTEIIFNNNPVLIQSLFIIPVLLLPFFIAGYHFGLIKIKLGIKWAIFAHALANCIVAIQFLLLR